MYELVSVMSSSDIDRKVIALGTRIIAADWGELWQNLSLVTPLLCVTEVVVSDLCYFDFVLQKMKGIRSRLVD